MVFGLREKKRWSCSRGVMLGMGENRVDMSDRKVKGWVDFGHLQAWQLWNEALTK